MQSDMQSWLKFSVPVLE